MFRGSIFEKFGQAVGCILQSILAILALLILVSILQWLGLILALFSGR